jgi:hypothetical protein
MTEDSTVAANVCEVSIGDPVEFFAASVGEDKVNIGTHFLRPGGFEGCDDNESASFESLSMWLM